MDVKWGQPLYIIQNDCCINVQMQSNACSHVSLAEAINRKGSYSFSEKNLTIFPVISWL